jgi:phytoene dehydrogenase-like protein
MYRVVETLTAIAEKFGVEFVYNSPVKKILVEGGHATGLELSDGQTVSGDIVDANADLG